MRRRAVTLLGFLSGLVAGTLIYRRSAHGRGRRVDLYFDDGSMVSLADGSPPAARLLPLAQRILDSVGGSET